MASFANDNRAFEAWLRSHCAIVPRDLAHKHEKMAENPFSFLRATFFRWTRRIERLCPELVRAPAVLSVGDIHIENFGTWRDDEGRLVWGVNDFDEAAVIPYAFDLVRLATSLQLLPGRMLDARTACAAIAAGYERGLSSPCATLLDDRERWIRPYVGCTDNDRRAFWREVVTYPDAEPPIGARRALLSCLPRDAAVSRFATCRKGGGSLGRPRYVVIAEWQGGDILREAKALVPSAWGWGHGITSGRTRFIELATGRFRSPDPWLRLGGGYILRRIAADARKLDLEDLGGSKVLNARLLDAMGFDLAAIHAGSSGKVAAIARDLAAREPGWLRKASKAAARDVAVDYAAWTGRLR